MDYAPNDSVYITVGNFGRIPLLHCNGPIIVPMATLYRKYQDLKTLGYDVTLHPDYLKEQMKARFNNGSQVSTETTNEAVDYEDSKEKVFEPNDHSTVVPTSGVVTDDSVQKQTKEEIAEETPVEQEEPSDEPQEPVYTLEQYSTWSKKELETLLRNSPKVSKQELKKAGNLNKAKCLELVEKFIVD